MKIFLTAVAFVGAAVGAIAIVLLVFAISFGGLEFFSLPAGPRPAANFLPAADRFIQLAEQAAPRETTDPLNHGYDVGKALAAIRAFEEIPPNPTQERFLPAYAACGAVKVALELRTPRSDLEDKINVAKYELDRLR